MDFVAGIDFCHSQAISPSDVPTAAAPKTALQLEKS
jgi:hypothetical protein